MDSRSLPIVFSDSTTSPRCCLSWRRETWVPQQVAWRHVLSACWLAALLTQMRVSSGEAGQYRRSWCRRWKLLHHPGTHLEHHPLLSGNVISPLFFFKVFPLVSYLFAHSHLYVEFPSPCLSLRSEWSQVQSASQPVDFPFTKAHQSAARRAVYVIHTVRFNALDRHHEETIISAVHRLSSHSGGMALYGAVCQVWAGMNCNNEHDTLSFFDGPSAEVWNWWATSPVSWWNEIIPVRSSSQVTATVSFAFIT